MDETMTQIGSPTGLNFVLRWETEEPRGTPADATRGSLAAYIGERIVWGSMAEGAPSAFEWTWVELLEHLAAAWRYLEWEELDPLGLQGPPERLRVAAEERWQDLPGDRRSQEEEALWAFERTHNLAAGLQGAWAPDLWLLREGRGFLVAGGGVRIREPAEQVLTTLESIGAAIAERLERIEDDRARHALESWRARRRISPDEFVAIATALPRPFLDEVSGGRPVAEFWHVTGALEPNEVLAVARMIGPAVGAPAMRRVVDHLAKLPALPTPDLDAAANEARQVPLEGTAWDQGYSLAAWLRARLDVAEKPARVDPEELLDDWGVPVRRLALEGTTIDAVCCWGGRHGPAVLVNSKGPHAQGEAGRRATLAHEIAHLLLDRGDALPLAEVLGGRTPVDVETRARAFAAEFLLPRSIAAEELSSVGSPERAVRSLCKRFGASREIVAWQVRSSGVSLSARTRSYLRGCVSQPWKF